MKKIYYLFMILAVSFAATSCGGNSSDEEIDLNSFYIIESDVIFSAAGGNGYVDFSSDETVTATSSQSWCTVTVNGRRVNVTTVTNDGIEGRSASIILTSGGKSLEVPAHQYGAVVDFTGLTSPLRYSKDAQKDTISSIESNVPLSVSFSESWATATVDNDNNIIITLAENTGNDRTCTMTVTTSIATHTYTIIQTGAIVTSVDTVYIGFGGGSATVNVNAPTTYTATAADSWCTTSISGNTLTVTATAYGSERKTNITINSGVATKTLVVVQTLGYSDAVGTWDFGTCSVAPATRTVTITQLVAGKSYTVTGVVLGGRSSLPFIMTYDNSKFYIKAQYSAPYNSDYVWYCPWDTSAGYLTWNTDVGLEGTWGGTATNPTITFGDYGSWASSGYVTDGILLYTFSAQEASGDNALGSVLRITSPTLSK